MYVTALKASGYRNLDGTYPLCFPLSVLVGENNAGKSNVIDALRTVLESEAGPRGRTWLSVDDFAHDGQGNRITDQLELEVQLGKLSEGERAHMVTCLAPSLGPDCARIRLRAKVGADERVTAPQYIGGDAETADVERHAREAIRFTYLHPLRDAAADLRPGRDNRLVGLLDALAPEGSADRDAIIKAIDDANDQLQGINAVKTAKGQVAKRLGGMTGRGRFQQQTDLAFNDPRFDRVIGALRAQIGRLHPLEMSEGGLGFNNLLYMAVLLAALADQPDDAGLRVLLVEEPEAHLHPQLQDLLMRFLEDEAGGRTQVIVTSHSPTFASAARVQRLTVLSRQDDAAPIARRPSDFGLTDKQLNYLRRFLDVTKAALFFARGVILVEGVAEQLLLPAFARRLQRPLAANGVTVINVGGVAFPPFTELFGDGKLPYKLAVVSDDDRQPDLADLDGSEETLSPRARDLEGHEGANVLVRLAPHTFEWALAEAGNKEVMLQALAEVKPQVAQRLKGELANATPGEIAEAILKAVKDVKGRFAQELAALLDDETVDFEIPEYVIEAISWVADEVTEQDE